MRHSSQEILQRSHLTDWCDTLEAAPRLVTVIAPAGYGKSTLLDLIEARLEASGRRVVSLALTRAHSDPDRLTEALASVILALRDHTLEDRPRQIAVETVAAAFKDLWRGYPIEQPAAILIDDIYLSEGSGTADILAGFLESLPENVTLILASRHAIELDTSELRARGEMRTIDAERLRFTPDEARAFMQDAPVFDSEAVDHFYARTEGWAVGLQLARLALDSAPDPEALLRGFSGADRDILDYLAGAVLARQPDELRQFLLQAAVLDRFNADLCAAVTGNERALALIEEIEARNLFLVPLDREREWYRFHHLFADALRRLLQREDSEALAMIRSRAASWFEARGEYEEAMDYFLEAGDYKSAADLLETLMEQVSLHEGRHDRFLAWIERLPDSEVTARPRLAIGMAWSLSFLRRHSEAIARVEAALNTQTDPDPQTALDLATASTLADAVALDFRDALQSGVSAAERLATEFTEASPIFVATGKGVLAYSGLFTGDFQRSAALIQETRDTGHQHNMPYLLVWSDVISAMVALGRGRAREALDITSVARQEAKARTGRFSYSDNILSIVEGGALAHFGEYERVFERLLARADFIEAHPTSLLADLGYGSLAEAERWTGAPGAARVWLERSERAGAKAGLWRQVLMARVRRLVLELQLGEVERGLEFAAVHGLGEGRRSHADRSVGDPMNDGLAMRFHKTAAAHIALARNDGEAALALINPLALHARRSGRMRNLGELCALSSVVHHRHGDRRAAGRAAAEAVEILDLDEAGLRRLIGYPEARDIASSVFEVRSKQVIDTSADNARARMADLTERERQIIEVLLDGRSNREIAERLFISIETVKWHLHNAYAKLGLKSRNEALRQLRPSL